jgi:hypothetical protein
VAEENWHAARLIPTSGINGADEQERRATSALLAVVSSVREFGRALLTPLGAPAGTVETYIEVPFDLNGQRVFPDGLIRVSRGQRRWTALVEVKTGTNELAAEQLEAYLDVARAEGFQTVLTISNQIPAMPGTHPTAVDKRKLKKVELHHLPWTRILTEAVMQRVHRGVSDPDQAWILGELIRYLEHPRSGAMEFEDMGANWVATRDALTAGTLRPNDKGAAEVANRWDQLVQYAGLRLGRQLGTEVEPVLSRKELAEPALRVQSLLADLTTTGCLNGALKIPHAVAPIHLVADLRAQRVHCTVTIDAPAQGRQLTRVNWLLRQLRNAPDGVRIDAFTARARSGGTSELLRDVRQHPEVLVEDPKKDIVRFRLTLSSNLGTKRGQGRGSFVASVLEALDSFYGEVVQDLKAWAAPRRNCGLPIKSTRKRLVFPSPSSQPRCRRKTEPMPHRAQAGRGKPCRPMRAHRTLGSSSRIRCMTLAAGKATMPVCREQESAPLVTDPWRAPDGPTRKASRPRFESSANGRRGASSGGAAGGHIRPAGCLPSGVLGVASSWC